MTIIFIIHPTAMLRSFSPNSLSKRSSFEDFFLLFSGLLARYIYRSVGLAIIGALLGIWLLQMIFSYLEELGKLNDTYTLGMAFKYILWQAPQFLYYLMPMAVLVGCVVGLGLLANNSELVVMRTSGLGVFQIVTMALLPALIFTLIALGLSQYVIPKTNLFAQQTNNSLNLQKLMSINGYWFKQGDLVGDIDYANANGELKNIRLWHFDAAGNLDTVTNAASGSYCRTNCINTLSKPLNADTNSDIGHWQLNQVSQISLDSIGNSKFTSLPEQQVILPIQPNTISLLTRNPSDMSISELWHYLHYAKAQGNPALTHELEFWKRIFSPLTIISLVLMACSFIFGSLRQTSLGLRIVMALLFGIVFNNLQDLAGYVSLSLHSMPMGFVLLPIIGCALLGIWLLKRQA